MTTHGKNGYFAVEDGAATTLRNISAYVTNVTQDRGNDQHDNTTYGQSGHTFQNGLTTGQFNVTGFWDKTASVGAATVLDSLIGISTTVGFEWGPEGNTAGLVKYSGEVTLVSVNYSAPVADLVAFSAVFNLSGAATKGVFS